jgi:hypothetical protein
MRMMTWECDLLNDIGIRHQQAKRLPLTHNYKAVLEEQSVTFRPKNLVNGFDVEG